MLLNAIVISFCMCKYAFTIRIMGLYGSVQMPLHDCKDLNLISGVISHGSPALSQRQCLITGAASSLALRMQPQPMRLAGIIGNPSLSPSIRVGSEESELQSSLLQETF